MIEPAKVSRAARKNEEANLKFRAFLKNNVDSEELDKHFLQLHNELFAGYDCCQCNNCCREFSATVQENEVDAIAAFLGLSGQEFSEKYLVQSIYGERELAAPCCFLKENGACAIQECKPAECKDFPHTDKPDRLGSLLGVVSFAEVCPVVFEILERLKKIYRNNRHNRRI
ncbi:MAG: YkgJ family cysteine cluster protein [Firmicutes bacterium]|nr:YkgJ family cysteine cluster protein [Bacillota bacterium]